MKLYITTRLSNCSISHISLMMNIPAICSGHYLRLPSYSYPSLSLILLQSHQWWAFLASHSVSTTLCYIETDDSTSSVLSCMFFKHRTSDVVGFSNSTARILLQDKDYKLFLYKDWTELTFELHLFRLISNWCNGWALPTR